MTEPIELLDVVYCEGWDAESKAVAGPLDSTVARGRDEAGEQYAVLLLSEAMPRVLIEIAWRHHACTVWHFDTQLRRADKYDLRKLADERLFLIEEIHWQYPDSLRPELDITVARRTRRCFPSGMVRDIDEPGGDRGGSRPERTAPTREDRAT